MTEKNRELLNALFKALDDKKGENIKIIDISKISVMTDYFVITNGNSQPQVDALVDAAEEALLTAGVKDVKVEGGRNNGWTLIDAGNLIIHIFTKENRDFYDLERIWSDGKTVEL
ncbi:MAG: ribosome silencing factor [Lachnospiraceae bacterium]|nr:ribosome silencing factor [Lachnospiraceae bacterium]